MRKHLYLYLCLVTSIVSWGVSFVAVKIGLKELTPNELACYRFIIASIAFIPISVYNNLKLPNWKDLKPIVALALFGIYGYHLSLNYATQYFPPNAISFISNSSPIVTTLFAITFLKEKVKKIAWSGLALSIFGVYIITNGITLTFSFKLIILFLIPILWSIFFLVQKPLLKKFKPIEIMSYGVWIGTLFFLLTSDNLFNKIDRINFTTHMSAIYLGLFSTAIAYLCWSFVLSKISITRASSLSYLVPIVTIIASIFLLNEHPTILLLIGGVLILAGVYLVNFNKK